MMKINKKLWKNKKEKIKKFQTRKEKYKNCKKLLNNKVVVDIYQQENKKWEVV
jgi:hypothetical protein